MSPNLLLLAASFVALAAAIFRPDADRARWAGCAVSVLLLGFGLGLWWQTAPAGELGTVVSAPAQHADGESVTAVVTLENDLGVRRTHQITLSRDVPGGAAAFLSLICLGVLGLVYTARASDPEKGPSLSRRVCLGGVVGAAAVLAVFYGGRHSANGESGVRQFLDGFDVGQLQFFSVPSAPWTYTSGAELPLILGLSAVVVAALASWIKAPDAVSRWGLPIAATLGALACIWQTLSVDGVPWRSLEGSLWSAALLLGLAAFRRDSAARSAILTAMALVVVVLGPMG